MELIEAKLEAFIKMSQEVLRLCLTMLPNCNTHHFDKDFEVQLTKFLKHVSA
ncbi:hypothetical protein ACE6H2_005705 [Prunus campanulata]